MKKYLCIIALLVTPFLGVSCDGDKNEAVKDVAEKNFRKSYVLNVSEEKSVDVSTEARILSLTITDQNIIFLGASYNYRVIDGELDNATTYELSGGDLPQGETSKFIIYINEQRWSVLDSQRDLKGQYFLIVS